MQIDITGYARWAPTGERQDLTLKAGQRKSQSRHHLVGVADGVQVQVRLYDRLLSDRHPDASGKDFIEVLNPNCLKVVTAYVEPSLAAGQPDQKLLFERFGYFVADRVDHNVGGKVVFNRMTG